MNIEEYHTQISDFTRLLRGVLSGVLPGNGGYFDVYGEEIPWKTNIEAEFPLRFNPPREPSRESGLYAARIRLGMGLSRSGEYLAVMQSSFALLVGSAPVLRFDYEKVKDYHPAAHLHISGSGTWLSPALMINRPNQEARQGKLEALHIPVGGHRFRPSVEEFLYFLIHECGFEGRSGWRDILADSRARWLRIQLGAAVRDDPREAAHILSDLGYAVIPPEGGHPQMAYHSVW
ncbi:hypothetical protein [Corynebacterium sp. 22KM0430]|uniref:hypothetical protein n=1 Tax=Corynebacterium sp. 22KM0430 TaxID=2989735 RepID=UPI0029C9E4DD|nr:hypothetical protein [Corynebacterium sp. 22KM0430]WPF65659.1 hypothetical protein OLX12_08795 [Corynebacterium sp. 22KM0430]